MTAKLLLDERILADGTHASTWARVDAGRFLIDELPLPIAAVERVMRKFGRELADDIALSGDALELGDGARLVRLRYHAPVDATGRDYLVWQRAGEPPLAVIAAHATAALRYLVLRLAGEREDPPRKSEGDA